MNGWIKHFNDDTIEVGYDGDNRASWSKGRLAGMSSTSVHHNGMHICISGQGEYWQSDDFDSDLMVNGPGEMVTRRVAKRLRRDDEFIQVLQTEHSTMLRVVDLMDAPSILMIAAEDEIERIPPEHRMDWLILEYDIPGDWINWYFSGEKI